MTAQDPTISTGNNFVAEEDIMQTLEDGRVVLLAPKGAAVPMAVAQRMGLPELAKRGIGNVTPDMAPSPGPAGIQLGLTPDQISELPDDAGTPTPADEGTPTQTKGTQTKGTQTKGK